MLEVTTSCIYVDKNYPCHVANVMISSGIEYWGGGNGLSQPCVYLHPNYLAVNSKQTKKIWKIRGPEKMSLFLM